MHRRATTSLRARTARPPITAALALALITGCASPYDDYCETKMQCLNGNELDLEACIIAQDASDEVAAVHGCETQWQAFVRCRTDKGKCTSDDRWLEDACNDDLAKLQACEK